MQRPASNRAWCVRWDELSSLLLEELKKPDCDVDQVKELVASRRRLTMANPVNTETEPALSEEAQRAWLLKAQARERDIEELARTVQERVARSILSNKAGRTVRQHFKNAAETPVRVFNAQV